MGLISVIRCRLMRWQVFALSVVTGLVIASPVAAQGAGQNQGNPTILDAVQALQNQISALATSMSSLQTQLNSLQSTVNNIQTSIQTITPAESNVRTTPAVFVEDDGGVVCWVTNVSDATIRVKIDLIDDNFGIVLTTVAGNFDIEPLEGTGFGHAVGAGRTVHCRFTVVSAGGSRTNIRGMVMVANPGKRFDGNTIAAE